MNERKCPICNTPVIGRAGKKFCSVKCKSVDQYDKKLKNETFYLQVDKQLKINRKILKQYNKAGHSTIRKSILHDAGFNPNFFTHYWKNKKGDVYLFVYEYGFLNLSQKEKYLIVIWQDYMKSNSTINK